MFRLIFPNGKMNREPKPKENLLSIRTCLFTSFVFNWNAVLQALCLFCVGVYMYLDIHMWIHVQVCACGHRGQKLTSDVVPLKLPILSFLGIWGSTPYPILGWQAHLYDKHWEWNSGYYTYATSSFLIDLFPNPVFIFLTKEDFITLKKYSDCELKNHANQLNSPINN